MKCHSRDLNPGLIYILVAFPNDVGINQDHLGGKYFLGRKIKELELLGLK